MLTFQRLRQCMATSVTIRTVVALIGCSVHYALIVQLFNERQAYVMVVNARCMLLQIIIDGLWIYLNNVNILVFISLTAFDYAIIVNDVVCLL